jgi:hypothetical protein
MFKMIFRIGVVSLILFAFAGTAPAKNKFEKELDAEAAAVKLVRDVESRCRQAGPGR